MTNLAREKGVDDEKYKLTADQISRIAKLLKLPKESEGKIISDLSARINAPGVVTLHKDRIGNKSAAKSLAKELTKLQKTFTNLERMLSSMAHELAFRIDEEFSFAVDHDQSAQTGVAIRRKHYSLRKIASRMAFWSEDAAKNVSSSSYYFPLYSQIDDFLCWTLNPSAKDVRTPNAVNWKLAQILLDCSDEEAKMQLRRWKAARSRDK